MKFRLLGVVVLSASLLVSQASMAGAVVSAPDRATAVAGDRDKGGNGSGKGNNDKGNGNGNGGGGADKVTICHRTSSMNNPYVEITVDRSSVDGEGGKGDHYLNHRGPVWDATTRKHDDWGDIIPPIKGVHDGLNWDEAGRAIWANGCNIPPLGMDQDAGRTVVICEATDDPTDPYRRVEIPERQARESGVHFDQHGAPAWQPTQRPGVAWGDIIPDMPGLHDGLNWNARTQAIYHGGCTPDRDPTPDANNQIDPRCRMDYSVMLDASTSVQDAKQVPDVRSATNNFLDKLEGTQSWVRLGQFGTDSEELAPRSRTTAANLAPDGVLREGARGYFDPQPPIGPGLVFGYRNGTWQDPANWRVAASPSRGWTNWENGLRWMRTSKNAPDLAIFVTDGDPTAFDLDRARDPNGASGNIAVATGRPSAKSEGLDRAVQEANRLKDRGVRLLVVGVGEAQSSAESQRRLTEISGPRLVAGNDLRSVDSVNDIDVAVVDDFSELDTMLKQLVGLNCDGSGAGGDPDRGDADQGVLICHRTDDPADPYRAVTVPQWRVDGKGRGEDHFLDHRGPEWDATMTRADTWGDIIPPIADVHGGLNWDEAGQAFWERNCDKPPLGVDKDPGTTVVICEATDDLDSPYREAEVREALAAGDGVHFADHNQPAWQPSQRAGVAWGDIIPPMPGVHDGLNWNDRTEAIYHNGCAPDVPREPDGNNLIDAKCRLNYSMTLDASTSIPNSGTEVRAGANEFLDAVAGTRSTLRLGQFGTRAATLTPRTDVTAESTGPGGGLRRGVAEYFDPQPSLSDRTMFGYRSGPWGDPLNWRLAAAPSPGWTNWDDGLQWLGDGDVKPDLAIFVTDGDPTAFNLDQAGDPNEGVDHIAIATGRPSAQQEGLDRAVQEANRLKDRGIRVLAIGVGSIMVDPLNIDRLTQVAGPKVQRGAELSGVDSLNDVDVAVVERFGQLDALLRNVADTACPGS